MLTLEQAQHQLEFLASLHHDRQRERETEIEEAFETFLALGPDRIQFRATCKGLLFTPDMLFLLGNRRR